MGTAVTLTIRGNGSRIAYFSHSARRAPFTHRRDQKLHKISVGRAKGNSHCPPSERQRIGMRDTTTHAVFAETPSGVMACLMPQEDRVQQR